jgi:hypothetical protein
VDPLIRETATIDRSPLKTSDFRRCRWRQAVSRVSNSEIYMASRPAGRAVGCAEAPRCGSSPCGRPNQTTSFFLVTGFGSGAYSAKLLNGTRHRFSGLQPAAPVGRRGITDIRAYVGAQSIVANETAQISAEKMPRWSKWALAQADRIDPVRSARFIDTFDEKDDAN